MDGSRMMSAASPMGLARLVGAGLLYGLLLLAQVC